MGVTNLNFLLTDSLGAPPSPYQPMSTTTTSSTTEM